MSGSTRRGYGGFGLAGLFIVVGLVLFFLPEPATTTVGIVLLLIGVMLLVL